MINFRPHSDVSPQTGENYEEESLSHIPRCWPLCYCAVPPWRKSQYRTSTRRIHPNLAAAQRHVVEANQAIAVAQKDNHWDMHGHAEKARQLLVEVNNELKAAAETANRR